LIIFTGFQSLPRLGLSLQFLCAELRTYVSFECPQQPAQDRSFFVKNGKRNIAMHAKFRKSMPVRQMKQ
jgi:hypothetical protein